MNECRGELLARVRRGLGTAQDRIALEAHLVSCESCAQRHEIGEAFEAIGAASPGDTDLVLRLAERVSSDPGALEKARRAALPAPPMQVIGGVGAPDPEPAHPQSIAPPARAKRRVASLAAAAVLVGGMAAASFAWRPAPSKPGAPGQKTTLDRARIVPSARPEVADPPPREEKSSPEATGSSTSEHASPGPAPPPETNPLAPPRTIVSPAELYRTANRARRDGESVQAIRLYSKLQSQYPGSVESNLSHVSLGNLLLARGSNAAALTQYDAYLRTSDARLGAEALYGRGRALAQLGRIPEELETWRKMLATYPSSAYATHARKRISTLSD